MSFFYRCAVPRGPLDATAHCSKHFSSVTTSVYQPRLLSSHAFPSGPRSPFTGTPSLLGHRRFASSKTPKHVRIPKPTRPTKPSKIPKLSEQAEALTARSRERYERNYGNKHSVKDISPFWTRILWLYAALTVIWWGDTVWFQMRHSEDTPVTGRRRFAHFRDPHSLSSLSPSELEELGEAFQELEGIQGRLGPLPEHVRKVFMNIAVAAGLEDREWKVYVLPDPDANAVVMHALSVVIITGGMFKHIKRDDDLAVVLAHELAHVVAKHNDEEHSREKLEYWYGIPYLPAGIVGAVSAFAAVVTMAPPFIVGACLLIPVGVARAMRLEASREQEKEADIIGLLLMTEAGYNPYAAHGVWVSMKAEEDQKFATAQVEAQKQLKVVQKIPEHQSTHPLSESRIEDTFRLAPQAIAIVKGDMRYLQRQGSPIHDGLRRGWAEFKASRDLKRSQSSEPLN